MNLVLHGRRRSANLSMPVNPLRRDVQARLFARFDRSGFLNPCEHAAQAPRFLWKIEPMARVVRLDYLGRVFAGSVFDIDDQTGTALKDQAGGGR